MTGAHWPSAGESVRLRRTVTSRCLTPSASPGSGSISDLPSDVLNQPRLARAIGVIYRPEIGLHNHYFEARLAQPFDAVIHIDRSRALEPLERGALWDREEPADTYPNGL